MDKIQYLIMSLIVISIISIFSVLILFKPSKSYDMNYKKGLFYPFFLALVAYTTLAVATFLDKMF